MKYLQTKFNFQIFLQIIGVCNVINTGMSRLGGKYYLFFSNVQEFGPRVAVIEQFIPIHCTMLVFIIFSYPFYTFRIFFNFRS